jgi:hypothetical protein
LFTTLVTRMSWPRQLTHRHPGFGMQCVSYIYCKVASCPGIMVPTYARFIHLLLFQPIFQLFFLVHRLVDGYELITS